MVKDQSRRDFLRTAPLAAAVTLPLTEMLHASAMGAGGGQGSTGSASSNTEPFEVIRGEKLAEFIKTLQVKPGNQNLYMSDKLPFSVVLTTEEKKSGKEFEYHEGRDHIFHILDGTTKYELGGTPKDPHSTKPGEWLAPASEGATTLTLSKGDMLVIPRGTPHKRSTEGSVTLILISIEGQAKA
jgi:mannose-6-phosphate isomerase-like protein (cupin superfamily)